jgi:hypothetical protein
MRIRRLVAFPVLLFFWCIAMLAQGVFAIGDMLAHASLWGATLAERIDGSAPKSTHAPHNDCPWCCQETGITHKPGTSVLCSHHLLLLLKQAEKPTTIEPSNN